MVAFLLRYRKQNKNACTTHETEQKNRNTKSSEQKRDEKRRNNVYIEHLCVDRLQSHKHLSLKSFPTLRLLSMWYGRRKKRNRYALNERLVAFGFQCLLILLFFKQKSKRIELNQLGRHIERGRETRGDLIPNKISMSVMVIDRPHATYASIQHFK